MRPEKLNIRVCASLHLHSSSKCPINKEMSAAFFHKQFCIYVCIPAKNFQTIFPLQIKNKSHDEVAKRGFILKLGVVTNDWAV